ncbi:MAG: hypothetical protein P8J50_00940 [Acidimicrobiales bacterium]|nr:hypothetical protein [Acidimicrobiales bacterium]
MSEDDSANAGGREALQRRLELEFGDRSLAGTFVDALEADVLDRLVAACEADIATAAILSYRPPTVPDHEVGSLWILAFGYRFVDASAADQGGVPPMTALAPGPVNEALAREAAAFTAGRPVPIVAQWEVARALEAIGIDGVISVEPDVADDGSVIYLSTLGVLEKGLRLAAEVGVDVGQAGVLGQADHAWRCVDTARSAGLTAAVPTGIQLPADYDEASGQPWTRSRASYLPVDLLARSYRA